MNQNPRPAKLQPQHFEPNQAWVIFHHSIEGGTYFLIDAATSYIFGSLDADSLFFDKQHAADLLKEAWKVKSQWPEKLIISYSDEELATFTAHAQQNNVAIEAVPESTFASIVAPIKRTLKNMG